MCQKKFENMQRVFQKNTATFDLIFFLIFFNKQEEKGKINKKILTGVVIMAHFFLWFYVQ